MKKTLVVAVIFVLAGLLIFRWLDSRESLTPAVNFQSDLKLLGVPLLDVRLPDQEMLDDWNSLSPGQTIERATARGWISIGLISIGLVSIGGISLGVLAGGTVAIGLHCFGVVAVSVFRSYAVLPISICKKKAAESETVDQPQPQSPKTPLSQ